MPVTESFEVAQTLLKRLDLLNAFDKRVYNLIVDIRSIWNSRDLNAVPSSYEDGLTAARGEISAVHQSNATRSLSWLKKHGKCIDHIIPGRSTLPGAGHGAFANRRLPKRTLITGSPLLHVFRYYVHMYGFERVGGEWLSTESLGNQLLLNYCFGHKDSSLLLCPYGAGVNYINHNATLANVRIQWATNGTSAHNSACLDRDPSDFEWDYKPCLGIDYVATKDIKKGEELFLDYGYEWEQAWLRHSETWKKLDGWSAYVSAATWNKVTEDEPLRTEFEQLKNPYPDNLVLKCHPILREKDDWKRWDFIWNMNEYGDTCSILARTLEHDGSITYSVAIRIEVENDDESTSVEKFHVPREAILFFDLPYTTDIHLPNAYRHEIGIPDEIFPKAWRDLSVDRFEDGMDDEAEKMTEASIKGEQSIHSTRYQPDEL